MCVQSHEQWGNTFSVRETIAKFSPMIDGIYTFSDRETIAKFSHMNNGYHIFSPGDYRQIQSHDWWYLYIFSQGDYSHIQSQRLLAISVHNNYRQMQSQAFQSHVEDTATMHSSLPEWHHEGIHTGQINGHTMTIGEFSPIQEKIKFARDCHQTIGPAKRLMFHKTGHACMVTVRGILEGLS